MSREILFKGRKKDSKEWVQGRLLAEDVIVPVNQEFEIEANCIYGCNLTAYIVDPDTVGEYTGLSDKNDRKIFEGDIVKATGREIWGSNRKHNENITVTEITDGICEYLKKFEVLEVIGNIYEQKKRRKRENG